MGNFVEVGQTSELEDGAMKRVLAQAEEEIGSTASGEN